MKFVVEGISEPFGIKVKIIGPGVISTNIFNSVVVAKKSRDRNSPYAQITQKMALVLEKMMKEASSSPELVAKVDQALHRENPSSGTLWRICTL
jgi:short-subunit dehydrogenase